MAFVSFRAYVPYFACISRRLSHHQVTRRQAGLDKESERYGIDGIKIHIWWIIFYKLKNNIFDFKLAAVVWQSCPSYFSGGNKCLFSGLVYCTFLPFVWNYSLIISNGKGDLYQQCWKRSCDQEIISDSNVLDLPPSILDETKILTSHTFHFKSITNWRQPWRSCFVTMTMSS